MGESVSATALALLQLTDDTTTFLPLVVTPSIEL